MIRDLALGAELAKANKDRADYLEMRARAQVAVPEAELVERVRAVDRARRRADADVSVGERAARSTSPSLGRTRRRRTPALRLSLLRPLAGRGA